MPHLSFTPNLQRHVLCPEGVFSGATVREVLESAFGGRPEARSYVLDDQGLLRKHVSVFVNGEQVPDRSLAQGIGPEDRVFVMQALSGG